MTTTDQAQEEDNQVPVSANYTLECIKNSEIKITHKYTIGSLENQTFCVKFDPHDKYIAQGCNDGTIKIYNTVTGKQSYILNTQMDQPMPTTQIRWRPATS